MVDPQQDVLHPEREVARRGGAGGVGAEDERRRVRAQQAGGGAAVEEGDADQHVDHGRFEPVDGDLPAIEPAGAGGDGPAADFRAEGPLDDGRDDDPGVGWQRGVDRQGAAGELGGGGCRAAAGHEGGCGRGGGGRRVGVGNFLAGDGRGTEGGDFPQHIELAGRAFGEFEEGRAHLVGPGGETRQDPQEDDGQEFHRVAVSVESLAAASRAASSTWTW